ncbi:MAG TPA: Fur family transcriptional regulator [Anaerolineales bacterium]|nr:Fur family transcriptional regulator [Anaerolineales bacterium]
MAVELWLTQLQENGYRLTAARRAIVEAIRKSTHALTPVQVFDIARKKYHALGLVSVYRTLEKLEELHLIQRVHQPQGCQAFIAESRGHKHLLLCQNCGQVTFFEGDDLDGLIRAISKKTGYQVQEHWLQLLGLCQNCK